MIRRWATLLLVTVTLGVATPAITASVAHASTGTPTEVTLPRIPWGKVFDFLKGWGPVLLALADELWNQLTGPQDTPPHTPAPLTAGDLT